MEYTKWTKESVLKFCEDNFIGEGLEEDLSNFLDGQEAILDMDSADLPSEEGQASTELTIKLKLREY